MPMGMKSKTSKITLAFAVMVIHFALGCRLEAPPVYGDKCPPGVQHLEDTANPYIALDSLKCYKEYFVVSDLRSSSLAGSACCKESHDESGRVWQCDFLAECLEVYEDSLGSSLMQDYLYCQNYRSSNWFEDKKLLAYSLSCDNADKCEENTAQAVMCPEDNSNCSYNNERGFYCVSACSSPWLSCPDEFSDRPNSRRCIHPETSIWHCGAKGSCSEDSGDNFKGEICKNGMICDAGVCVCPDHHKQCGGVCVDIRHDPENCGGCGAENSDFRCSSGMLCSDGKCVEDKCNANTCSLANCENSSSQCGPYCINCNAVPHTQMISCLSDKGICGVTKCEEGFHLSEDETFCEMNSGERCGSRTSSDIQNCYDKFPNSEETYCDWDGQCVLKACKESFANVNGQCLSEADLCKSEYHQKFVDNECRCEVGYSPCYEEKEGIKSVLKCVALLEDEENCGACGNVCPDGSTCKQAQCQCDAGYQTCYDESEEHHVQCAILNEDPNHCGACNHACPEGAVCNEGKCQCKEGYDSCVEEGEMPGERCVNFQEDNKHCGACNHACPSGGICREGVCECSSELTACYNDSEKTLLGCADFKTDPKHCGECNHACSDGFSCEAGQCVCGSGRTECSEEGDDNPIRCVDLATDSKHCGSCNLSCSDGFICQDSKCQCDIGYVECSDESDETIKRCVDIQTDASHCGECNHSCSEGLTCQEGQCQ